MQEQRKSPRFSCVLPVDLYTGSKPRRVSSVNVSRHGIFLSTDEVIKERFLVQLLIHLPDGALNANAVVSRTVQTAELSGIGVQFFAQSASSKRRWDEFVFGLTGHMVTPGHDKVGWSQGAPDRATYLVKLKDRRRLVEFQEKNVNKGGLYLATPVIKEAGAEVALIIIHPDTEEEYLLTGRVERVCLDAPKGMEISIPPLDVASKERFLRFIETGQSPEGVEALPAGPAPRAPTPIHRAPSVGGNLPYAFPPEGTISEDLSIDITVDLSALEDSAQFGWEDVGVEDLVIDFDVTDPEDEATREVPTDDLNTPTEVNGSTDLVLASPGRDRIRIHLVCQACRHSFGDADLGPLDGPLGLIASRKPYWCTKEDRLVGVIRLNSPSERRQALGRLDEATLDSAVRLRALFQVADFSRTARCDHCGGPTRANRVVKEVGERVADLAEEPRASLVTTPCPECGEPALLLERLS